MAMMQGNPKATWEAIRLLEKGSSAHHRLPADYNFRDPKPTRRALIDITKDKLQFTTELWIPNGGDKQKIGEKVSSETASSFPFLDMKLNQGDLKTKKYLGNTQQFVKTRTQQHVQDVKRLVINDLLTDLLTDKRSDSFASHSANLCPKGTAKTQVNGLRVYANNAIQCDRQSHRRQTVKGSQTQNTFSKI
jgi:hypothetical protein